MHVCDAILKRKSVRDYLDKPVDLSLINKAIDLAKYSPSSTNMQPWEVVVVNGKTKQLITEKLTEAFNNKVEKTADYASYPEDWFEPFLSRRKSLGLTLYSALNIERSDKEAQRNYWVRNYSGFGAPTLLFIFTDKRLSESSYIDCGIFMQSLMLAFEEQELATCPQASFIEYAAIIKEILGDKYQDKILISGLAVGYEDTTKPVNQFRSERASLDEFVDYFE